VFAGPDGAPAEHDTPFYTRGALRAGDVVAGPAIVEQLDSTVLVPPEVAAEVDEFGNIRMTIEGEDR
jgi:N-methylhydantoinase A